MERNWEFILDDKILSEIIGEHDLNCEPHDNKCVLERLRALRYKLHPDRTEGNFIDDEHELKFQKIVEHINYIKPIKSSANTQTALIEVSQHHPMVEMFTKTLIDAQKPTLIDVETKLKEQSKISIKQKYYFPKVTSGLLATAVVFIFAFLGNFSNHPIYKQLEEPRTESHFRNITDNLINHLERSAIKNKYLKKDSVYSENDHILLFNALKSLTTLDGTLLNNKIKVFRDSYILIKPSLEGNSVFNAELNIFLDNLSSYRILAKNKTLEEFSIILITSLIILCTLFTIVWLHEKSEERWIEYITTDEGANNVLLELYSKIKTNKFTKKEFVRNIEKRNAHLLINNIADVLLNKLQKRNVIKPIEKPSLHQWYEIIIDLE